MHTQTRYYLIYIFLFVLSINSLSAQTFQLADYLFKEANFTEAALEYERTYFYAKDNSIKTEAKYRRALCYRSLGESEKAISDLQKINLFTASKDMRIKVIYESIINSFLLKKYKQVELYINKMKFYNKDKNSYLCLIPTYILSLNSTREWIKAKEQFIYYVNSLEISAEKKNNILLKIESLYAKKNIPKEYIKKTAVHWSRFIPGAGQMYTGNVVEGLFAFSLCSAFVFTAGYSFYYEYYFTGYILGLGMLYESYMGGMKRVAYLVDRKNNDTMNLFNKNCVNLLIDLNK